MKGLFSIRAKFLTVIGGLLMACVVVYLLIAVHIFKTDKTELVYDLNRSMVSNLSVEIDTLLNGVSDKLRLFALLTVNQNNKVPAETVFGEQSDVVFATLYEQKGHKSLTAYTDKKYLEAYGLKDSFFNEVVESKKVIPFEEILKNGEATWNASVEGGIPLVGYGKNVVVEDASGIPQDHFVVVAYIKLDKVLKVLKTVQLSEVLIVNSSGDLLVHSSFEELAKNKNLGNDTLFKKALESKVNLSVASINEKETSYLGAFGRTYAGQIYVIARASQDEAFSAVYELVSRSLSFALIVMTLSLLLAFLFSRSLTKPISILVEGMEKVSTGDLSTQIKVTSRDETQMLAQSFNQMIFDLKQSRDELQQINRELDQKVKDRTVQLEIQNQAVKEAQEALLKTTRLASAGEIAGRAAHEVLNPLTGIITRLSSVEKKVQGQIEPQLQLLRDIFSSWKSDHTDGGFDKLVSIWRQPSDLQPKESIWQEDMKNIESVQNSFEHLLKTIETDTQFLMQESQRINKIISGMRKLSRLQSDIKSYAVHDLLIDCRNIMADLFNQKDIQIIEKFEATSDHVFIDRDEFIQAITNLMRNSVQSFQTLSEARQKFVQIQTRNVGSQLVIELMDNGTGISKENQNLLFKKQFTTKSADEGTGLGLGISRRFIRGHGGDIEFVSSEKDLGTVFKIILPLKSEKSEIVKVGAA